MKVRIETARFGTVEVDEEAILEFVEGLPGFPDCRRFVILEHDRRSPVRWMQSVDRGEIAFLVADPHDVLPAWELPIPAATLERLGIDAAAPGAIGVLLILNVAGERLTANLRAPVVVDVARRRAMQVILEDDRLPLRHPVGAAA